jgi:protocatechuate 3,4-dioxygenase beta subunit
MDLTDDTRSTTTASRMITAIGTSDGPADSAALDLDAGHAHDHAQGHAHDHDRGLRHDVDVLIGRRRLLGLLGGLGVAGALAACGGSGSSTGATAAATSAAATPSGSSSSSTASGSVSEVPDETAGPYPGDGSNGPNSLDDSGIVRRDIRSSYDISTTTAQGVPLTIRLTVRDASTGSALTGAAVYLWHCDRDGKYSLYTLPSENYLRGVQETDGTGTVEFTSVFPGCYDGRWPHIHFEVYSSLDEAVTSGPIVKTSQIALPQEACEAVYAVAGYESSVSNLSRTSLARDNVFGDDGGIYQLASMSGDVSNGYTASLTIGV